jgi:hypothetical protein
MDTNLTMLELKHVMAVIQCARDYNNKVYGHGGAPRPLWNQLHFLYNETSQACYDENKPPVQILGDLVKDELRVFEMWNDNRLGMHLGNKPLPDYEDHVKDLSELEANWDATVAGLTYNPVNSDGLDLFEASGDVRDVWDAYPARVVARNLGVPLPDPGPMVKYRGTMEMLQKARESGVPITSAYVKYDSQDVNPSTALGPASLSTVATPSIPIDPALLSIEPNQSITIDPALLATTAGPSNWTTSEPTNVTDLSVSDSSNDIDLTASGPSNVIDLTTSSSSDVIDLTASGSSNVIDLTASNSPDVIDLTAADPLSANTAASNNDSDSTSASGSDKDKLESAKRKNATDENYGKLEGAPSANIDFPKGNISAAELMAFLPYSLRSWDVIERLMSNGGATAVLTDMVNAFRVMDKGPVTRNSILRMMQLSAQRRPEARYKDWHVGQHQKPEGWDYTSLSVTDFRPPRLTHPRRGACSAPYNAPVKPIPFKELARGVKAFPAGDDCLDLTRCVKYCLEHPTHDFVYPDDFETLVTHIGGPATVRPENWDQAAFFRWRKGRTRDPPTELKDDYVKNLAAELPNQTGGTSSESSGQLHLLSQDANGERTALTGEQSDSSKPYPESTHPRKRHRKSEKDPA